MLPNGQISTLDFPINPNAFPADCTITITDEVTATSQVSYILGQPAEQREVLFDFSNCGTVNNEFYSATVTSDAGMSTVSFTTLPLSKGFSWQSSDTALAGTYTVSVTAKIGCKTKTAQFVVEFIDCSFGLVTVSIVPPFTSTALQYTIQDPIQSNTWTEFQVSPSVCLSVMQYSSEILPALSATDVDFITFDYT